MTARARIRERGLSKNHINSSNTTWILRKSLPRDASMVSPLAGVVGVIIVFCFKSVLLGIIIATALLVNLICAAANGVVVPLLLKRFDQDPAWASSVLLNTVTDVIGFFAFSGLTSWRMR